ncbi:MAG: hypothetical protein J0H43_08405, partial [Actinobacteria bacterium]|nr:hypothetical protein [Actinomycetota bacterium]
QATAGTGLTVSPLPTGLLGFLSSITTDVAPLTTALSQLVSQTVAGVAAGLTGAGLSATNSGTSTPTPSAGTYPTCTASGWSTSDCYGPLVPTVSLPSLLTLSSGTTQGYAAYSSTTGYSAAAKVADPVLGLLGITLANLGIVQSTSSCTSNGSCTQTQSISGASLLGGAVQLSLANGRFLATVNGVQVSGVAVPLSVAGIGATISANGNLLTVKIALTLTQLLNSLGLGSLLSSVVGLVDANNGGPSATLTLTVGPGSSTSNGTTSAWGLDVGVDLSANINISLLGLAGVSISVPSGIGGSNYGNLLDLKLAYTNAASGQSGGSGPVWYPPGLI